MDGDQLALQNWIGALDSISYYELFHLPGNASHDEVRIAFQRFCETFHPDVHCARAPQEQLAIGTIYRRGTEAYRILSDPALRARYDAALAKGDLRPDDLVAENPAARPTGPSRPSDSLKNLGAKPFVLRAEELHKKGDAKQAKLQLSLAMSMDRGNPVLEAFAEELDRAIKAAKR